MSTSFHVDSTNESPKKGKKQHKTTTLVDVRRYSNNALSTDYIRYFMGFNGDSERVRTSDLMLRRSVTPLKNPRKSPIYLKFSTKSTRKANCFSQFYSYKHHAHHHKKGATKEWHALQLTTTSIMTHGSWGLSYFWGTH